METRRLILYAALGFVLYSLWTAWQIQYPSAAVNTTLADTQTALNLSSNSVLVNDVAFNTWIGG